MLFRAELSWNARKVSTDMMQTHKCRCIFNIKQYYFHIIIHRSIRGTCLSRYVSDSKGTIINRNTSMHHGDLGECQHGKRETNSLPIMKFNVIQMTRKIYMTQIDQVACTEVRICTHASHGQWLTKVSEYVSDDERKKKSVLELWRIWQWCN